MEAWLKGSLIDVGGGQSCSDATKLPRCLDVERLCTRKLCLAFGASALEKSLKKGDVK